MTEVTEVQARVVADNLKRAEAVAASASNPITLTDAQQQVAAAFLEATRVEAQYRKHLEAVDDEVETFRRALAAKEVEAKRARADHQAMRALMMEHFSLYKHTVTLTREMIDAQAAEVDRRIAGMAGESA